MRICNNIHVSLSTLSYMFRRLWRHIQGELYRMLKLLLQFWLQILSYTGWHKKRELLKTPTKTVEIQQKKIIDRNWTITTCRSTDP
jgi:hypothetical protein